MYNIKKVLIRLLKGNTSAKDFHLLPIWLRQLLFRMMAGRSSEKKKESFSLVIFKLDRIGDFILSLSAIQILLREYGQENSLLILSPVVASVARQQFPDVTILELPGFGNSMFSGMIPVWRRYARRIREMQVHTLVCLRHQRTTYHNLVLSWFEARQSFGAADPEWCIGEAERELTPFAPSTLIPFAQFSEASLKGLPTELETNRQIVSNVLGREIGFGEILPTLVSNDKIHEYQDAVLIAPLGSEAVRSYAGLHLANLCNELQKNGFHRIILAGDHSQQIELAELQKLISLNGAKVEILPPGSLIDFISVINSVLGVISVETATAHIAVALNRPTVGIIGGGHYGYFAPWDYSSSQIWVTNKMDCFHCNWECIYNTAHCIVDIPYSTICSSFMKAIAEGERN